MLITLLHLIYARSVIGNVREQTGPEKGCLPGHFPNIIAKCG